MLTPYSTLLLDAGNGDSSFWIDMLLPLGLVLLIASLFSSIRKRRRQEAIRDEEEDRREQAAAAPPPAQPRQRPEPQFRLNQATPSSGEDSTVRVEGFVRRYAVQLDAKARTLEQLLDLAEHRIKQLEAALDVKGSDPRSSTPDPAPGEEISSPPPARPGR
ncbi:MAG: hypothetical protein JJU36_16995 [Phycisphaeraceae bacterium]|nr:hypothetical protein [Phycisphaeraceae bacterium]